MKYHPKPSQQESKETNQKISNAKKGMTLTTEHKINIGNSVRGLIRSDESKIRYSKSKMGDKNPCKRQDVKDKIRKSIINLYKANPGIKNRISKSVSKFFLESPDFVSLDELESYEKFRKLVNNLTKRVKKELLENWNGLDYYDNIEIKDNFRLHYNNENYPTIDHKISILEGYKKGYQPEEISSIDNLCLTKRKLNTQKGFKSEQAFKDLL